MPLFSKIFATIAALLHVVFFVLESLLWMQPRVHSRFRVQTLEHAEMLQNALFNQGFYNLFIALGCLAGVVLVQRGKEQIGVPLVVYTCLFMVGAALVLLFSSPGMLRGALIQGGAPLIALLGYVVARRGDR